MVSIHVPARGTTSIASRSVSSLPFQSTFPHGERPKATACENGEIEFQSTFPHGERRGPGTHQKILWRFQSTFPHGERQCCAGATGRRKKCFNPRSRTGNDSQILVLRYPEKVSIHVPARGTTLLADCNRAIFKRFNPRSRTGNDAGGVSHKRRAFAGFNPRSRTGNDGFKATKEGNQYVSIHVPARGTTQGVHGRNSADAVSIHVPARGTTNVPGEARQTIAGFNPRSRTGND